MKQLARAIIDACMDDVSGVYVCYRFIDMSGNSEV